MRNIEKLKEFLFEAKQSTFIKGAKREIPSRPHSKDYAFKKYNYYYLDSHVGKTNIIGEELIWQNEQLTWGMNYKSEQLLESLPSGFDNFLKLSLKNIDKDFPVRGPKEYINNNYKYICSYDGDLTSFSGTESIYYNDDLVYKLFFHGGTL